MSVSGWEQLLFVVAVTAVAAPLLGRYLAATFRGAGATGTSVSGTSVSEQSNRAPGDRVFLPVERLVYRILGVDPITSGPGEPTRWRCWPGVRGHPAVYAILRLQGVLPGNPTHVPGMSPLLSFNTAISFITGTNWQAYEGETQASYLADTVGLVVAQFIAAGVGLAVALAVVRGIAGKARTVGNFWVDFTRSLVRVFVPLSIIGALVMVSQGAVQNLSGFRTATTLAGGSQKIPGGLVASMEAIKLLGTNGGSYYGVGGAHPFENPDRIHQHVRSAFRYRAAVRYHLHVRPAHRQAAAGLRPRRGDGHHLRRPHRRLDAGRTARQPSAARVGVPGGERRQPRREHGGQGHPVRP